MASSSSSAPSSNVLAVRRLRRELAAFHSNSSRSPNVHVSCDEWDMLRWNYLIRGPPDTPYQGGWYWGRLQFPDNYPLAPPSVVMVTPSGRFLPNTKLCLSVSSFHPENWKPAWGFANVLEGLITFMSEDTTTVGSIDPPLPTEERQRLACESAAWNSRNPEFCAAFPEFGELARTADAHPAAPMPQEGEAPQSATDAEGVPPDETVPPEFTCSICMKLLLDPVSVSCGHTFCRKCLDESLDYHSLCALCRSPLTGGQSVNMLIKGLIAQKCPRTLERRKAEHTIAADNGTDTTQHATPVASGGAIIPLLHCADPPFPHCKVEVELHTPAEIKAVDHSLRGSRRVGLLASVDRSGAVIDGGVDAGALLGCCAEVQAVRRAQGNTAASASLVGLFRFRLAEQPQSHAEGFDLGRTEKVGDAQLAEDELRTGGEEQHARQTTLDLAKDAVHLLQQQLGHVGDAGRHAFRTRFGQTPALDQDPMSSASLEQFSFWLAGAICANAARRRLWLQSTDTRARLEDCRCVLVESRGKLVLNLPGAESWMYGGRSGWSNLLLLLGLILLFAAKSVGFI